MLSPCTRPGLVWPDAPTPTLRMVCVIASALYKEYGDSQNGLRRIVELQEKAHRQASLELIHCAADRVNHAARRDAVPVRSRPVAP